MVWLEVTHTQHMSASQANQALLKKFDTSTKCVSMHDYMYQFIVLQRENVLILREESPKGKTHTKGKRQTETARFGPISGQIVTPLICYPPTPILVRIRDLFDTTGTDPIGL